MNIGTFKKLPEKGPVHDRIGEIFLEGESVVGQKAIKDVGDSVTYYEISKITDKGYEYDMRIEVLTK